MKKLLLTILILTTLSTPITAQAVNTDDLLLQIQSLLKIVTQLQTQLAELNGGQSAPTAPAVSGSDSSYTSPQLATKPLFCQSLSLTRFGIGHRSPKVMQLQKFLKSTGDFTYPEFTNYYGSATTKAVQRYQERNNVVTYGTPSSTGYGLAGPGTRRLMCSVQTVAPVSRLESNPTPIDQSCGSSPNSTTQSRTRYQNATESFGTECSQQSQVRTCTNGSWGEWGGSYTNTSCSSTEPQDCTLNGVTKSNGQSADFYNTSHVAYDESCDVHKHTRSCSDGIFSGNSSYSAVSCTTSPVPYFEPLNPTYGPWSSYQIFGRRVKTTLTDLSGVKVSERRINFDANGSSELQYCKKASDGSWPADCSDANIEQRVIKRGCVGGNDFFWLRGYKDKLTGNRFKLGLLKAIVTFDDGREYDVTDNSCNNDVNGEVDGIPYALFNIVDGYRMKIWFTQLDLNNKITKVNYWEQHYSREFTKSKCWRGVGPNTVWAIVQRQAAWQIDVDDRNSSPLVFSSHGIWKLNPSIAGGDMEDVEFDFGYGGLVTVSVPSGENTNLVWESSNGLGKGAGWTGKTEYGEVCMSELEVL